MEDLIPVVNKLQDVFSAIGQQTLNLPQIVVVGSQSSGKSSVLESIVGRDFLPRGSGIVTRRPLILQLHCTKNDENFEGTLAEEEEWGEFLHLPDKKFYDFNEIRAEISRETDRTTGKNKGISKQTINLKIFSPYILNLTLVDLPGVTKVPIGDQPSDIEKQIREMSLEFISNPNAIIVAVSAANQDLSNSDGLQLALTADPEGLRTIGVLTKVDLMDQGTDASEILLNRIHPLRKGYVAVVNRSQKDINDSISIRDGIAKETTFFQTHSIYRSLLSKCGTGVLTNKLNQLLMQHIRECLPGLKSQLSSMLFDVVRNLESLGESADDLTPAKQGEKLLKIISKFCTSFNDLVNGKETKFGVDMDEVCGGARILSLFNDVFAKNIVSVNPFNTLRDQDIQTAMVNSNGIRYPLFIPESSFDLLVRKLIVQLEQPGIQCVDYAYEEMIRMCEQIDISDLGRYPSLQEKVFEVVQQLLLDCVRPTQIMITNIIQCELAYINTSHPDFIGGKKAASVLQQLQQQQLQQQQLQQQQQQQQTVGDDINASSSNADSKSTASPPNTQTNQIRTNQSKPVAPTASSSSDISNSIIGGGLLTNIFRAFPPTQQSTKNENISGGGDLDTSMNDGVTNRSYGIKLKKLPDRIKTEKNLGNDIQIIKLLISSYFDIVKKNFTDIVPKIIMNFLVLKFKESLQNELISKLYKESLFSELLNETDDEVAKRLALKEMRDLLNKAMDIVHEVRDYNVFDK